MTGIHLLRLGAPGEIRTPDLLVRSQTLYPTELRALDVILAVFDAEVAPSGLRIIRSDPGDVNRAGALRRHRR